MTLVDRAQDRRPIPPATYSILQARENGLRTLLDRVSKAVSRQSPTSILSESRQALDQVLNDEAASCLAGLLRRPNSQLAPNGREITALVRYLDALEAQGTTALMIDTAVAELQSRVGAIANRFFETLPWTTARHIASAGLTADRLTRLRRLKDAERLVARAANIERLLESLEARLPEGKSVPMPAPGLPISPSHGEVEVALRARLEERGLLSADRTLPGTVRRTMARHLNALGILNGASSEARSSVHLLTEQLIHQSVESRGQDERAETGLWFGMLRGADLMRGQERSVLSWQAHRIEYPSDEATDVAESTLFVVPINEVFAYVSHEVSGPVRVQSRGVRVGAQIKAALGESAAATFDDDFANLDIAPLFSGLEQRSAWYRTEKPATLTIIAEAGPLAWYATIDSLGMIKPLRDAAWQAAPNDETGIRVVRSATQQFASDETEVGLLAEGATAFEWLGIKTYEVQSPVAHAPRAWFRRASSPELDELVEREQVLFTALERHGIAAGLRPLGAARLGNKKRRGVLYAPPLGHRFGVPQSLLADWIGESTMTKRLFLSAVARTLLRVHQAGYALITPHLQSFAFAPDFLAKSGRVLPFSTVIAAPQATPFGTTVMDAGDVLNGLKYPSIGFTGLVPGVAGSVATPVLDAVAFAVLTLDLLAIPGRPSVSLTWPQLQVFLNESRGGIFAEHLELSSFLIAGLADQSGWHVLMNHLTNSAELTPEASTTSNAKRLV